MLIDNVKIKNRSGIGWVLLALIPMVSAWLGPILTLTRHPIRLRKPASLILFRNCAFGNALFWGFLCALIGITLCINLLQTGQTQADERLLFYLYALPLALTGLLLMIYSRAYTHYRRTVNIVLEKIAADPHFIYSAPLTSDSITIQPKQLYEILCDLRDNGIITFGLQSEGHASVQIIAPELLYLHSGEPKSQPAPAENTTTWVCPGCGAPNTAANERCEYCGNTDHRSK